MLKLSFWPLWIALVVYCALIATNLFSGHHILFNLEPYPDGLWYLSQAKSLIQGHGLTMRYEDVVFAGKVPPVYSLALSLGFLVSSSPALFYVTNAILGMISTGFLWAVLRRWQKQPVVLLALLLLYVFHGYILWIVGLPMAENVALSLFLGSIWILTLPSLSRKHQVVFGGLLIGLMLTKYAYIFTVTSLGLVFFWRVYKERPKTEWRWLLSAALTVGLLITAWFIAHGFNPFDAFLPRSFGRVGSTGITYYSLEFMARNVKFYFFTLLGAPTTFLWQGFPLTSPALSVGFVTGLLLSWRTKKQLLVTVLLTVLLLSQFVLFSLFYVIDARYVIFSIPILVLGLGLGVARLQERVKTPLLLLILVSVFGLHLLWQASFFKQIVATNWLQRSRAWQYEAVVQFNRVLSEEQESFMITALPPVFVDFYRQGSYQLLPLSSSQEFANKNQKIWGDDINYTNLSETYTQLIREGKKVYISNAYLTAQSQFTTDYQHLQQQFTFTPVSTGCENTCDVYALALP